MPFKRLLSESRTFDPHAVAVLLEAYDGVAAALELREFSERETAAGVIVRLALGQPDLDAARLRDDAIAALRKGGAPGIAGPSGDAA